MSFVFQDTLRPPTVSTPARTLNSAGFQPNAGRPVLVKYCVRIQSGLTLVGGAAGLVQLVSDSNTTPTTVRDAGRGGATGTVVIGVATNDDSEATLSYMVPAGDYVRILTTNTTGTPTFTLEVQVEEVL